MTDEPMRDVVGARLERELARLLEERHPGPAPYALRSRIDRVQDPDRPSARGRAALVALLSVAAVLVIVAVGVQSLRLAGPRPGPAASPMPTPLVYDPAIVGPGVLPWDEPVDVRLAWLLLPPLLTLVLTAAMRARWRVVALAASLALSAGAAVVMRMPGPVGEASATSIGEGVVRAEAPFGFEDEEVTYVTAKADEPFRFGFTIRNPTPFPMRVAGFEERDPYSTASPRLQAVWLDTAPWPGIGGPGDPFEPIILAPDETRMLWFVMDAGPCAWGPTFDPARDTQAVGTGIVQLRVRSSVLFWQQSSSLEMPLEVWLPQLESCLSGS
jgi:hypothetical protein